MPKKPTPEDESPTRSWQPVFVLTISVVFLVGWGLAWWHVRDRVASQEEYALRADGVRLTPLPPWIRSDVKSEVLEQASLDARLSTLDEGLAEHIYHRFPLHPWIARVTRVTKQYPAGVQVDVVYRRPVCVVEVTGGVYPADVEGVRLPSGDFSPVDATRYPLLRDISTPPPTEGSSWNDERVLEGCRLAKSLADVWMELQLASIAPLPANEDRYGEPYRYELLTRGGTHIHWGQVSADGDDGQTIVQAKIARLRQHAADHGSLDTPGRTIHLDGLGPVSDEQ